MRLTINDLEATVSKVADMRGYWDAVRRRQFSEVWLDVGDNGPLLLMLVNAQLGFLMYFRDHAGDPGLTPRNPEYSGPPDALVPFVLKYGQGDHLPVAWTYPLEQAIAACEYFVETQGGRSPDIVWHDDANDEQ